MKTISRVGNKTTKNSPSSQSRKTTDKASGKTRLFERLALNELEKSISQAHALAALLVSEMLSGPGEAFTEEIKAGIAELSRATFARLSAAHRSMVVGEFGA